MAFTTTVLAWSLVDYEEGYTLAGTYSVVTQNVRFGKKDFASVLKVIPDL